MRTRLSRPRLGRLVAGATAALIAGAATVGAAATPITAPGSGLAAPDAAHAYRQGVVPMLGSPEAGAAGQGAVQPATTTSKLSYAGGRVVTGHPHVYLVYWGTQWGKPTRNSQGYTTFSGDRAGMAPVQQAFFKGLGTDSETWSGIVTQYCQGVPVGSTSCPVHSAHVGYPTGGALAGVWYDASAPAPADATEAQIIQEATNAAIHFGALSAAAKADAQFVITSPHGARPDGFNPQGGAFCAWHDSTGSGTGPYDEIAFTNMPYLPDAGRACGAGWFGSALDGVTIVGGHEFAETLTDPDPVRGWRDPQDGFDEVADKCAWQFGPAVGGYLHLSTGAFVVPSLWANDAYNGRGGCETAHPIGTLGRYTVTLAHVPNQGTRVGSWVYLRLDARDSASPASLTFSVKGLPPGLVLLGDGVIHGRPTRPGVYRVTVTARDPWGAAANTTFTWVIGR